jgi:hypothetical protein
MAYKSPEEYNHSLWLGYVQPVGLVVSIPALLDAGAHVDTNYLPKHQSYLAARETAHGTNRDFPAFAEVFLGWPAEAIGDGSPFDVYVEEYAETLAASYTVCDPYADGKPTLILCQQIQAGTDGVATNLDKMPEPTGMREWEATPQAKFERLLRQNNIAIGLLLNGDSIRLVYAPSGESSGHITFHWTDMSTVAGRPLVAALYLLLGIERLFALGEKERLPAILANSRKFQNQVSTQLSGQILAALYELLRGFQSAHAKSGGTLLSGPLEKDPDHIYHGLLTILLRLVFLLFAEDRELVSTDPVYTNYYSLSGLFLRLREDDALYHDSMDSRYGGWAQLLTLFRLVHGGGSHAGFRIPPRHGYLFDSARYGFLEGRMRADDPVKVPQVSDGVLFRVLSNLLILDGERLSYRNLDVEQIGSVYEAVMGFSLEVARGPSLAITSPEKAKGGAPVTVNLEALLRESPAKRAAWLKKEAAQAVTGKAVNLLKAATTIVELEAALDQRIDREVTPYAVPKGALIFQPSDERRKSGSHYTPRALTKPIVKDTLEPVLAAFGVAPTPEQILDLKVCDPALGSGAFLVEVCRQLGDALLAAWKRTGATPTIPPDEDELLLARRTVAQLCLYGVDRNEMAADLAKLSLWLATLAKDHPFTFLNHAIRHGDSLVGLELDQIAALDWQLGAVRQFDEAALRKQIDRALVFRKKILDAQDLTPYEFLEETLGQSEEALKELRVAGDIPVAAFFAGKDAKRRRDRLGELAEMRKPKPDVAKELADAIALEDELARLRRGSKPLVPFHWPLEFPEVFSRQNPGFDAMVGNPPFAGKNTLLGGNAEGYVDWLKMLHEGSHGNADLAAHFFRRAFYLLRKNGCFGLIATNTIAQGDTRSSGLRYLCVNGATIYRARKRLKWPGNAAVVVSVVNVQKGKHPGPYVLGNSQVETITAYLFHRGGHEDPAVLRLNAKQSFEGVKIYGMGFTFDDSDKKDIASPLATMRELVAADPRNQERIFPYIGGEEVNDSPTHEHRRYVINFENFPLERQELSESWASADHKQREAWLRQGIVPLDYSDPVAADWPDLIEIVRRRVKPDRDTDNRELYRRNWWRYGERRPGLVEQLAKTETVFVICRVSKHLSVARLNANVVPSDSLTVITTTSNERFAILQSRVHEVWARLMASSMKDDLRYTPTDCFETFPFPVLTTATAALEGLGEKYFQFRTDMMLKRNQGLTSLYNDFHDQLRQDDQTWEMRRRHDELDQAVLAAYGWHVRVPECEFVEEFAPDEDEEEPDTPNKKKFRYRWPDDFRDEILTRLLLLNKHRAEEEAHDRRKHQPIADRLLLSPRKPSKDSKEQMSLL